MNENYELAKDQIQYPFTEEGIVEEEDWDGTRPIIETHVNEDGTTSSYFDKRKLKIAPRSTLQFKVGPPFEFVGNYYHVTESGSERNLNFCILPRIDRGFDFIDNEWVGYKRNYFTLVSSFETPEWDLEEFLSTSFELHADRGQSCKIKYFAITINARSDDDQTEINLVQHTAKRDKGPQFTPAMAPLIPSALPNHQIIREASNVRNTTKMKKYDSTFYFHRDEPVVAAFYPHHSLIHSYPNDCIQKVARYERVQFASSINVKKPTQQNKHFRLHVVLGAVVPQKFVQHSTLSDTMQGMSMIKELSTDTLGTSDKDMFIPLQEMKTPPLIIRGRSPSNYTTSQRIAVRTSSYNNLSRKELSIGMTSPNPTLASQMSAVSRSSLSPKKARPGRPSKRKPRVVKSDSPAVSPLTVVSNAKNFNENPSIDYSEAAGRNTKRVETLEYIEQLFQNEGPLGLRSLNHCNISPHMEYEPYRPPLLSRHRSVDPRDIELKPFYNSQEENMVTVGPLQFFATLKSQCTDASSIDDQVNNDNRDSKSPKAKKCKKGRQSNHCKSDKVGKSSKCSSSRKCNNSNVINTGTININKRKLNGTGLASSTLELSLDETKGLVDNANERNDFVNPETPASPLSSEPMVINSVEESLNQELESISLSMLADSSSNYCHVSSSSLTEVDAIPRTFNRVIGAGDSTSYSARGNGQFLSPDAPNAMSGLPSQVVNTRDLYEELSFYMH